MTTSLPTSGRDRSSSLDFVKKSLPGVGTMRKRLRAFTHSPETTAAESSWEVGGRYKAGNYAVALFEDSDLERTVGALLPHEPILLVSLEDVSDSLVAFVVQSASKAAGWIMLSSPHTDGGTAPLVQWKLESSWEVKARYCVRKPATLRETKALTSPEVAELAPGTEVISMQLGSNDGEDGRAPRLRMLVSSDKGVVGWLSPETRDGSQLLHCLNLLSPKVAEVGPTLSGGGQPSIMTRLRSSTFTEPNPQDLSTVLRPRYSYQPGMPLPWVVGGQYRVLDKVVVRSSPELSAAKVAKLSGGTLVTVQQLTRVQCVSLGWCPCAQIEVNDGMQDGKSGWVRCSDADGRDLIDVRNQGDIEVALRKQRSGGMSDPTESSPTQSSPLVAKPALRKRAMTDAGDVSPTSPGRERNLTVSFDDDPEEHTGTAKAQVARTRGQPVSCMDFLCCSAWLWRSRDRSG